MVQHCHAVREFPNWFHLCGSGLETVTELLASESGMALPMLPLTLLLGQDYSVRYVRSVTVVSVLLDTDKNLSLIFNFL
jgi:hypothetical protein